MELLEVHDTALSESVRRLLCIRGIVHTQDELAMSSDNILNFEYIAGLLPSDDGTPGYYEQAITSLASVFTRSQHVINHSAACSLMTSIQPFLMWTGNEKMFLDCLIFLKRSQNAPCYNHLVLLLITAGLERGLGNLYLTKGTQCPSMLKDLLATKELKEILGDNVMQILRVLIGPPTSLNLRNLAWHGFLGDSELPHRYCCFLLLLSSSIGCLLTSKNNVCDMHHIQYRPFISWCKCYARKNVNAGSVTDYRPVGVSHSSLYGRQEWFFFFCLHYSIHSYFFFIAFDADHIKTFFFKFSAKKLYLICKKVNFFILKHYFVNEMFGHALHRYGYSLALLLPLLEHCCRKIFATVNGCPERVLTAESTSAVHNLREILRNISLLSVMSTKFVCHTELKFVMQMLDQVLSDGSENQLPTFLGSPCMDFLLDLLSYPEGPRVRDRLSHGEVDFQTVGHFMVDPFIYLAIFLADKTAAHMTPSLRQMAERVNTYKSHFHPIAVLKQKINSLLSILDGTESLVFLTPDLEDLSQSQDHSISHQENLLLKSTQRAVSRLWQHEKWTQGVNGFQLEHFLSGFKLNVEPLHNCSGQHFVTSLRWQGETMSDAPGQMREQEYVGLLIRITDECCTVVHQVQQMLQQRQKQFFDKQLRSRQRDNLQKLLLSVPCLQVLCTLTTAAVCWHLALLHNFSSLMPDTRKLLQRHLKLCLQHCENLRSDTAPDKNKWTEGVEQMVRFLPKLEEFVSKWPELTHV
ncbi:LOW QUALITY PROTEIN: endoplasmic reticulum membrane-associated RNA degradation protein-like [Pomacea canaliculata]|uniref:LOW QUALITY PROTEIN: endoplasmic reticulum membrane-associated RNA degradation protein-like n=1 Tax=Pomacea canaliculata TaxID=400727 RepID=UPI000D728018|nr:LOW QUALITY PROTEIN: endoplasmic reticulum membrane-associated RNA degradation protein-like [Pomacea canaliculata]